MWPSKQTEAFRAANGSTAAKSEAERRHAEMQSQIITASTLAAGGSGGGGGARPAEQFVTHGPTTGKEKTTGNEDFTTIDDWIKDFNTDLEIIMPDAKITMKEAET